MCFTLMQHYIGCGHTDACFIDCDDRRWYPSCRDDGLTSEWRDHSSRQGVAHSYRRQCPTCAQVAWERDRDGARGRGVGAWRRFAESHQDVDGERERGRGGDNDLSTGSTLVGRYRSMRASEGSLEDTSLDSEDDDDGLPAMNEVRLSTQGTQPTVRLRGVGMPQRRDLAGTSSADQFLTQLIPFWESRLNTAPRSISPGQEMSPVWQGLYLNTEIPEEQALRDLYERVVTSCLVKTPIVGELAVSVVSGMIESMISRMNGSGLIEITRFDSSVFQDPTFDYLHTQLNTVLNSSSEYDFMDLRAAFMPLGEHYRHSREVLGDDSMHYVHVDQDDQTVGVHPKLQGLILAWFIVMLHVFDEAAQISYHFGDPEGRGSAKCQELILNEGSHAYTNLIRGLTADDLFSTAEQALESDSSRPRANDQSGGLSSIPSTALSGRYRSLYQDQNAVVESTGDESDSTASSVTLESIVRPLTGQPRNSVSPLRDPMPSPTSDLPNHGSRPTSIEVTDHERSSNSRPTHDRNTLCSNYPQSNGCVRCHGYSPWPSNCQDTVLSSSTHNVLFHFAACGHYNAINTEALRLRDDQRAVVAQCGCLEFPDELLMERKASSLRSCLFCREVSASETGRDLADHNWKNTCLRRQVRTVINPQEIALWPLELC